MKKIFFLSAAIAACFFVSCKDEKTTTTTNSTSESIKQKNADFMTAIETGDFSKAKEWLATDAVDHGGNPDGSDLKGRDSIIGMLQQVNKSFQPGFKMKIITQAVDGDYLFSLTEMDGTTTANPAMGMPPNTKMDMKSVDVIKIKDGMASEHWSFVNAADMMKMMGGASGGAMPADHNMAPAGADKMMSDTMKK
ncbi:MAG: ester cyclase [Ferruginibacter sp.]